jgi:hypothetical protein
MEELHGHHSSNDPRKRIIPGVTHPPLPTDSAAKIAASPALAASRAPPPLRIPRNDPNSMQRPGHPSSNRPSYPPPQTSPSFPFPQPSIASHMRLSRPPGYNPPPPHAAAASSSSSSSSQGGRFDPRNPFPNSQGRPPPTTSASLSSRNPRVSLQIYEKRYLDQARPPPRPRTGDGSSPIRPSQFQGQASFIGLMTIMIMAFFSLLLYIPFLYVAHADLTYIHRSSPVASFAWAPFRAASSWLYLFHPTETG